MGKRIYLFLPFIAGAAAPVGRSRETREEAGVAKGI